MENSVNEVSSTVSTVIATYGLSVIGAIIVLIVGWWIAGWASRAVQRAMERSGKSDETLKKFFGSLVRYTVLAITLMMVLSQFGVQTASLIAVFGAAGLAIGLALQGTLSNVAAGVMLLIFRPFKVGQFISAAGQSGTVKEISLFVTELATPDNVQILIPNSQVWGSAITNFSFHETRRVDLVMAISYDDDIAKATQTCEAAIAGDNRVLSDPAPMVAVSELGDSSVNLTVRFWCNAAEYWPLKFGMTRTLKERFDQEGLSIPYPQQDVHMHQSQA